MVTGIETPQSVGGNQGGVAPGLSSHPLLLLLVVVAGRSLAALRDGAAFPPRAVPHGHFRKRSGFSRWLRRRGQARNRHSFVHWLLEGYKALSLRRGEAS